MPTYSRLCLKSVRQTDSGARLTAISGWTGGNKLKQRQFTTRTGPVIRGLLPLMVWVAALGAGDLFSQDPVPRIPAGRAAVQAAPAQTSGGQVWSSQRFSAKTTAAEALSQRPRVSAITAAGYRSGPPPVPLTGDSPGGPPATNHQVGTTEFKLAAEPGPGVSVWQGPLQVDACATIIEPELDDFSPTPVDPCLPWNAAAEQWVYEGKRLYANQRPLVELGRPWYQLGQLKPGGTLLGRHNLLLPQFLIYGDFRTAYASSDFGDDTTSRLAFEWNLNFDLRLTATERFTAFMAPLDKNGLLNTRWLLDDDVFVEELNADIDFGMLEGDLGAITGGLVGQTLPFDLPFAMGVMPLFFQNGIWMEDAVLGVAMTLPARNSRVLDISNMDITFFAALDNVDSPAFERDRAAAKMYGVATFIEASGGYWEIDYAFLEDRNQERDRSYNNIGLAYSRRYGRFVSNTVRIIVNAGQATTGGPNTADGTLVLLENSLITSHPYTFVPYFNLFAGFDRPQSAARAAAAGGILRNTGILFETDGITAYPTLDATANNTWGGAIGLNMLTNNFDQQLILEMAALQTMGDAAGRNAPGDQYGVGMRYQIPLSNAWILRTDAMYGFLRETPDIHGFLLELRHKF